MNHATTVLSVQRIRRDVTVYACLMRLIRRVTGSDWWDGRLMSELAVVRELVVKGRIVAGLGREGFEARLG